MIPDPVCGDAATLEIRVKFADLVLRVFCM